jgi:hypothetical protein
VLPSLSKAHQALFFQQKQKLSKLKLPVILFFKLSDQQNEAEQTETSSVSTLQAEQAETSNEDATLHREKY